MAKIKDPSLCTFYRACKNTATGTRKINDFYGDQRICTECNTKADARNLAGTFKAL